MFAPARIRPAFLTLAVGSAATLAIAGCGYFGSGSTTTTPATPPSVQTIEAYKDQMRDVLTLANVVFLDADEVCPCVAVGIADPAADQAVRNFAAGKGVPAGAVTTVVTPRIIRQSLRDGIRPIKGGLQIESTDHALCTMMATVFNNTRMKKGLLTAAHCTKTQTAVDGTDFFQAGGALFSSDFVGKEVVDPSLLGTIAGCPTGRLCRRSDVAYAEFTNSTVGTVGKLARPRHFCGAARCDVDMNNNGDELTIVGIGGEPTRGATLHKIGRTTGWTGGLVARTCVSTNVADDNGGDSGITMLCQHFVNATSDHGDSGSPVFELLQNDRVVLMGILWGGATDGSNFIYSALPEIETELGSLTFF